MPATATNWRDWLTWALIAWGVGAAGLLLRLLGGKAYGYRVAIKAPPMDDECVLAAVRRISEQFTITRPVPVVESDHLKVPFIWGLFRPRLVLPPRAKDWSPERLEAVLRHELAHVRRRDILLQFLAQVACCLYWVNPLTWILERWQFIERERACDDMAMGSDIRASDYAGHLMEVVEELGDTRNQIWVVSAMAEGTDFKDRILSVLDPVARRTAHKVAHTAAFLVVFALIVLPVASLHPLSSAALPHSISSNSEVDPQSDAFIALLDNPDPDVREHAAASLGESGNKKVIRHLIRVLRTDADPGVREHAASALGRLGPDEESYRELVEAYESDENARVRGHAAYALGLMREPRAFDLLVGGLESRYTVIRLHCTDALGMLGEARAVPHLEEVLEDPDASVRESAERALRRLRQK